LICGFDILTVLAFGVNASPVYIKYVHTHTHHITHTYTETHIHRHAKTKQRHIIKQIMKEGNSKIK
jgi:hypothetical protein